MSTNAKNRRPCLQGNEVGIKFIYKEEAAYV